MMSFNLLRKHLALPKTSWQLCLLAIIGGAASAFLIIAFMLSIEALQQLYASFTYDYISLTSLSRFDLPIFATLIILILARLTGYQYLRTGIAFVLYRLKKSNGIMPLKNTFNQFVGSALAISSGFSVGREGPAVHLGAAVSSYIGSKLNLPFNSIRTLCACGIAAGISASFNTPIAAVIFVMEVILREYKVHIFIPVMLASIVGSLITQSFYGTAHALEYFDKVQLTTLHYPSIVILGIILGILAFVFNHYLLLIIKCSSQIHIVPRLLLAAFITAGMSYFIPYSVATEVSAMSFAHIENLGFILLAGLLVAKVIMTISALGLGIPGGIVGPILGIGAIAGTLATAVASQFFPGDFVAADFALLGMAGFMAATLNAPLAALLAVVEMSNQMEIIVPAMVAIASACISSGQFFKNRSIFIMQLEIQKLSYRKPPIERSLQGIGVMGVMQDNFTVCLSGDDAQTAVENKIHSQPLNHSNLVIEKCGVKFIWHEKLLSTEDQQTISHQLIPLSYQSTLAEAYTLLAEQRCGAVYIFQNNKENLIGLVTFEQIRCYLLEGKTSQ